MSMNQNTTMSNRVFLCQLINLINYLKRKTNMYESCGHYYFWAFSKSYKRIDSNRRL